jgi:hypothetical protein
VSRVFRRHITHIGRWAHRLLGADSDLPATVITTAAQFIGLRMSLKPIDLYALARDDRPQVSSDPPR